MYMAKNLLRKVTFYINGNEVEAPIAQITEKVKQLECEQAKTLHIPLH